MPVVSKLMISDKRSGRGVVDTMILSAQKHIAFFEQIMQNIHQRKKVVREFIGMNEFVKMQV